MVVYHFYFFLGRDGLEDVTAIKFPFSFYRKSSYQRIKTERNVMHVCRYDRYRVSDKQLLNLDCNMMDSDSNK